MSSRSVQPRIAWCDYEDEPPIAMMRIGVSTSAPRQTFDDGRDPSLGDRIISMARLAAAIHMAEAARAIAHQDIHRSLRALAPSVGPARCTLEGSRSARRSGEAAADPCPEVASTDAQHSLDYRP